MIRLLLLAALVWLLYRLVKGLFQPQLHGPRRAPGGQLQGGELVQDPQCGVYVPKQTALKGPEGLYFCSRECLEAYREKKR